MKRVLALGALLGLSACQGFIDDKAAESTLRILEKSQTAARRLPDVQLAREALPSGIIQLGAFALAYPDYRGFRVLHADSLCQYAIAFVFDDFETAELQGRGEELTRLGARVRALAGACVEANLALLPATWRDARVKGGAAWDARVAAATKNDVPQLLWITTTDAIEVALNPLGGIAKLGSIIAALEKCIALQPGFHDSDAEMLLGTLLAGKSRFMGGPDGSDKFADARKQLGEGALLVDVMYARGVLVSRKDRAGFTAALTKVLEADATRWPERRLANELARMKAAHYLVAIDQLIPPEAPAPAE